MELELILRLVLTLTLCSRIAEGHGVVFAMLRALLFSVNTGPYPHRSSLQEPIVNYRLGNTIKDVFEISFTVLALYLTWFDVTNLPIL